jgi:hypothetical protein
MAGNGRQPWVIAKQIAFRDKQLTRDYHFSVTTIKI